MKYNDEIYNLSGDLYDKLNEEKEIDNKLLVKQNKVLKILLDKFKKELKNNTSNDGILKVQISSDFFTREEEGYDLIVDLIINNQFDSFAREYCMYLSKRFSNKNSDCLEVLWDYKTYFDTISINKINTEIKTSNNDYIKSINEFKKLSAKYQKEVLKSFRDCVDKYKATMLYDEKVAICKDQGHDFNNWKHNKWITIKKDKVEHENWRRSCKRCGYIDISYKEPKELVLERKEKEDKAIIRILEREIQRISNDKNFD